MSRKIYFYLWLSLFSIKGVAQPLVSQPYSSINLASPSGIIENFSEQNDHFSDNIESYLDLLKKQITFELIPLFGSFENTDNQNNITIEQQEKFNHFFENLISFLESTYSEYIYLYESVYVQKDQIGKEEVNKLKNNLNYLNYSLPILAEIIQNDFFNLLQKTYQDDYPLTSEEIETLILVIETKYESLFNKIANQIEISLPPFLDMDGVFPGFMRTPSLISRFGLSIVTTNFLSRDLFSSLSSLSRRSFPRISGKLNGVGNLSNIPKGSSVVILLNHDFLGSDMLAMTSVFKNIIDSIDEESKPAVWTRAWPNPIFKQITNYYSDQFFELSNVSGLRNSIEHLKKDGTRILFAFPTGLLTYPRSTHPHLVQSGSIKLAQSVADKISNSRRVFIVPILSSGVESFVRSDSSQLNINILKPIRVPDSYSGINISKEQWLESARVYIQNLYFGYYRVGEKFGLVNMENRELNSFNIPKPRNLIVNPYPKSILQTSKDLIPLLDAPQTDDKLAQNSQPGAEIKLCKQSVSNE